MRHESTRLVLTTACALVAIASIGLSSGAGASEISARQSDGTESNGPRELTATAATIPAEATAFRAVTPCRLLDTSRGTVYVDANRDNGGNYESCGQPSQ